MQAPSHQMWTPFLQFLTVADIQLFCDTASLKHVNNFTISKHYKHQLECEPMPNVMAALPNAGGGLCSTPQSMANAQYSSAVQ